MDYGKGDGMTEQTTRQASPAAEREARVRAQCPGWDVWLIRTWDRRTPWSAKPAGATVAVITAVDGDDELVKAVRQYERELQSHLEDARAQLAAYEGSGIGRDRAAVLEALVSSLEELSRKLGDQAGY